MIQVHVAYMTMAYVRVTHPRSSNRSNIATAHSVSTACCSWPIWDTAWPVGVVALRGVTPMDTDALSLLLKLLISVSMLSGCVDASQIVCIVRNQSRPGVTGSFRRNCCECSHKAACRVDPDETSTAEVNAQALCCRTD